MRALTFVERVLIIAALWAIVQARASDLPFPCIPFTSLLDALSAVLQLIDAS